MLPDDQFGIFPQRKSPFYKLQLKKENPDVYRALIAQELSWELEQSQIKSVSIISNEGGIDIVALVSPDMRVYFEAIDGFYKPSGLQYGPFGIYKNQTIESYSIVHHGLDRNFRGPENWAIFRERQRLINSNHDPDEVEMLLERYTLKADLTPLKQGIRINEDNGILFNTKSWMPLDNPQETFLQYDDEVTKEGHTDFKYAISRFSQLMSNCIPFDTISLEGLFQSDWSNAPTRKTYLNMIADDGQAYPETNWAIGYE